MIKQAPDWIRWPIHHIRMKLPFYFDTCRWLCQPLKRVCCIYLPGCHAEFVRLWTLERMRPYLECDHTSRRPNTEATEIKSPDIAEICNDCGVGFVTLFRPRATDTKESDQ